MPHKAHTFRNAPNAYCTAAKAAHTAVSVRRMFAPSATSTQPHSLATENSASVQPPSGPIATATCAASLTGRSAATGSSTSRRGRAPALSENINFNGALEARNACAGFEASVSAGMCNRRACCADSANIFFQRSERFAEAATSPLSLRPAASGEIWSAPSSVAFSRAHSNLSNFTMASSNSIRTSAAAAGSFSINVNSTSSRPTVSVRASHTARPSLSSYNCPGVARNTRPR